MFLAGAFLMTMTQFANAQTKKTNFLGGNLGFSSTEVEATNEKTTGVNFNFQFGHYIKDRLAIGLAAGYDLSKTEDNEAGAEATHKIGTFTIAPFVRLDNPLWQTRFGIYSDLGIYGSFGSDKTETTLGDTETKLTGFGAFYKPGIQFRLKDNISLLANFGSLVEYGYNQSKLDGADDKTTSNRFQVAGDHFGFDDFQFGINLRF